MRSLTYERESRKENRVGDSQGFEDRQSRGDWRVEWIDDDGGCEVAIFSGPNARERAIRYADAIASIRSSIRRWSSVVIGAVQQTRRLALAVRTLHHYVCARARTRSIAGGLA
jgi:hypothetical protein